MITSTFPGIASKRSTCTRCYRLKVKCAYADISSPSCERCLKARTDCVARDSHSSSRSQSNSASFKVHKTSGAVKGKGSTRRNESSEDNSPLQETSPASSILSNHSNGTGSKGSTLAILTTGKEAVAADRAMEVLKRAQSTQQWSHGPVSTQMQAMVMANKCNTSMLSEPGKEELRTWPIAVLRRPNCFQTALDERLITRHQAAELWTLFTTKMGIFLPYTVDATKSVDESAEFEPMWTLAGVIAAWWNTKIVDRTPEVISDFLERVTVERLYFQAEASLELQKVYFLLKVCYPYVPASKLMIHSLTAMGLAIGQDLGCEDDIEVLMKGAKALQAEQRCEGPAVDPDLKEQYDLVHERCEVYLAMITSIAALSINVFRADLLILLPNKAAIEKALFEVGSPGDKTIIYNLKMWHLAKEGLDILTKNNLAYDEIVTHYDYYRGQLNQFKDDCRDAATPEMLMQGSLIPIFTSYMQLMLSFNEAVINQLIICQKLDTGLLAQCAEEIVNLSWELVNKFTGILATSTVFPKYIYFRPLHALCALIRIRIIMWSLGRDVDTGLDRAFGIVQSAWHGATHVSYTAANMYNNLEKVQKFINLKLQNPTHDSSTQLTATWILRNILVEAMLKPNEPKTKQSFAPENPQQPSQVASENGNIDCPNNITPQSLPQTPPTQDFAAQQLSSSDAAIEQLFRELFTDLL